MKSYLLAMTLAVSGAAMALTSSKAPETFQEHAAGTPGVEDGRQLFATYCASCHGLSGHGDGPVGGALRVRPPDLALIAKRNSDQFVAARIERIIDGRTVMTAHGTFEMPVWGDAFTRREGLSDQSVKARIQAIVRYLATIQERSS
jgi:mono/diheme cytochrome c family protein